MAEEITPDAEVVETPATEQFSAEEPAAEPVVEEVVAEEPVVETPAPKRSKKSAPVVEEVVEVVEEVAPAPVVVTRPKSNYPVAISRKTN